MHKTGKKKRKKDLIKMKKLIALLLISVLVVVALAFNVNAASDFSIDVTGSTTVTEGATVEYVVTVNKVTYEGGLMGFDIQVNYDPEFFSLENVEGTVPATWDPDFLDNEDGTVMLYPVEKDGNPDNAITGDGKVSYKLTFKVLDEPTTNETAIEVVSASGNTPDLNSTENGVLGKIDIILQKKLSAPTNLRFEGKVAKWDAVENAKDYSVQLYKDGKKIGGAITVAGTSKDFEEIIEANLGGAYTFTVKANPLTESYYASDVVECTVPCNHKGRLLKPSITVTVDRIKGVVKYVISDPNDEDSVGSYVIRIYKNGEETVLHEIAGIVEKGAGTIPKTLVGGTEYDFTVQAISADNNPNTGNSSSEESSKVTLSFDTIASISVTKMPLLEYIEGETLDLSLMEVSVTYALGDKETVSFSDFEDYGIATSMNHGADLTLSMNGKKISVTLGALTAEEEITLVVESGECTHEGATTDEHRDPTCGVPGYDQTVCSLCGVAIEKTEIPATGNHHFSEWDWLFKPTQTIDGMRYHKCTICGFDETQKISYDEYQALETTPPVSTTPPVTTVPEETTEPDVTDNENIGGGALGDLGNIGKIFLYVLIAIFATIVLFIVVAIWAESRRTRRRRSHKRASRSSSARANYNKNRRR